MFHLKSSFQNSVRLVLSVYLFWNLASCADPNQEKQVRLDFRPHLRVCAHSELIANPEDLENGELDPSLEWSECAYLPDRIISEIQTAKASETCVASKWNTPIDPLKGFMPKYKGCKRWEKLRALSVDSMRHLRTLKCGDEGWISDWIRTLKGKKRCEIHYQTIRDAGQLMFPGQKPDSGQDSIGD